MTDQTTAPSDPPEAETDVGSGSASGTPAWAVRGIDWRTVGVVALVTVVLVLPLRALFRYQGPPMEEGFMLVFPEQVLNGQAPHRDFLHLYGPGSLWALAGWYLTAGVSITAERIFGLAQLAGIVFGVMALCRPWGRRVALASGLFGVLLSLTAIGLTALAWNGAVALAVASTWMGLRARRWLTDAPGVAMSEAHRRARRLLLGAGLLAGLALLFRPDIIVAVVLSSLAVGAGFGWVQRRRWLIGAGIGVAPYLVLIVTAGLGNAIRGMVLEPVFELRGGRTLPRPPSWSQFDGALQKVASLREPDWALPAMSSPNQGFVWFFLLPAVVAFVVVVGWWRVRAEPDAWRPRVLLAVGLLGLGMLPQAFQRPDSTHLAWVSCVPLAFAPAAVAEVFRHLRPEALRRHGPSVAAISVLLIPLLVIPHFTTRTYVDLVRQGARDEVFGWPVEHDGRRFFLGSEDIAQAVQQMIDEIGPRMEPGQRLVVGTADLRKTPYSDAYLYYLFPDMVPGTRYIEMDPGVANTEDSGLAEEIAEADWLMLSRVWDAWDEPNDSRLLGSDEPNQVVADQFCKVADYDGPPDDSGSRTRYFEVYQRCDAPSR
ncbi:hypothetical protein BH23ACT2_BH23ACT2_04660 [soil metagenome]